MKHKRFLLVFVFFVTVQLLMGQNPGASFFNSSRFSNNIEVARNGDPKAQYEIAQCYEMGIGIAKDISQSVYWYWKSADQDYAAGLNGLGCCYFEGRGVQQDYKVAAILFKRAAERGSAAGEVNYKEAKNRIEQSYP